jgi:hypothetical protein
MTKRSHRTLGQRPLSERENRLVERVASALAAYYGARVSAKYTEMALQLLRNRPADPPWRGDRADVESMVG